MPVTDYDPSDSRYNPSRSSEEGRKYPDPFFDLANNALPKNIKKLFKYCYSFFHTDPFLSNVVRKITEYPITKILYDSSVSSELKVKYDDILFKKLKMKTLLIEIGLDYNTYGNCFISAFMKTKRYIINPQTKEELPLNTVDYVFRNFKFHIKGEQGALIECEVRDEVVKSIDSFKLVRWNPENIDIKYNPITGESTYFYNIPNEVVRAITKGEKYMLETVPQVFIDAVQKKRAVELDKNHFYHFKRPGLSEADMGWGKPVILPALKKIYYLQILQRGNEAIAHEHIVPKKSISPANTATIDPLTQMNLPKWKGEIQSTVKKWRRDPNYIAVFPIPVQYQELGGNARGLMLTPEMRFLEENIINSLGVPIEFIKGGASWTGSSISLRIVENMFIVYRDLLMDFMNDFVIHKLASFLSYAPVKVKFKDFKMTDDAQARQLLLQLSELGKLSDQRLLDAFGYSFEETMEELSASLELSREQQKKNAKTRGETEGEMMVIQAKYSVKAQIEGQREAVRLRLKAFEEELQKELGGTDGNLVGAIEMLVLQLMYAPPEMQIQQLNDLQKRKPITHGLVMETMEMYQQAGVAPVIQGRSGNPNVREDPPNKKSPGSRESNKAKPKGEKTRANTRGEPKE